MHLRVIVNFTETVMGIERRMDFRKLLKSVREANGEKATHEIIGHVQHPHDIRELTLRFIDKPGIVLGTTKMNNTKDLRRPHQ